MGALIAFEQDANLDEFVVGQGIPVESTVTRELLVSLFVPESVNKLHDGAVIIRNLRIAKAGVFFPMPESRIVDASLGSRHRAALGITEETDAVVVVVSEERGTISFCFSGNIVSNLDGASLKQALLGLFGRKPRKKGRRLSTPGKPVYPPAVPARPLGTPANLATGTGFTPAGEASPSPPLKTPPATPHVTTPLPSLSSVPPPRPTGNISEPMPGTTMPGSDDAEAGAARTEDIAETTEPKASGVPSPEEAKA
jgi:hypothetical protein